MACPLSIMPGTSVAHAVPSQGANCIEFTARLELGVMLGVMLGGAMLPVMRGGVMQLVFVGQSKIEPRYKDSKPPTTCTEIEIRLQAE